MRDEIRGMVVTGSLVLNLFGEPRHDRFGGRLGSSDKGICFPEIFLEDHIYVLYTHITYVGLKLVSELQPYCNIFDFLEEISWFLRLENPLTC